MGSRLRLLLMLPFAPRRDAAHGGGRVLAQFLTAITERQEVALLCLRSPDEPETETFFRDRCVLVEEAFRPALGPSFRERLARAGRLLAAVARSHPMWVADWASRSFEARCRTVVREFRPDVVQLEFHVMGQYVTALEGCPGPRVLVEHEPGIGAAPYVRNVPGPVRRLLERLDRIAWQRYESRLFRRVDAVVVFTPADRQAIWPLAGATPVHVISPGVDPPQRPLDPVGSTPPSLLFVGNFNHPPNAEAALRLARSIFPAVRRHVPEATLYVVGDRPPPELVRLAGEQLVVTGWVPDVTPYLGRAALFVAPLQRGGGLRIKVLEALAAGKAVVATPLAVEGIDVSHGRDVCLAESDGEFVVQITRLLADAPRRASLGEGARRVLSARHGWEATVERYETLYRELLYRRGAGSDGGASPPRSAMPGGSLTQPPDRVGA